MDSLDIKPRPKQLPNQPGFKRYDWLHQTTGWVSVGSTAKYISDVFQPDPEPRRVLSPSALNGGYEKVWQQVLNEFSPRKFSVIAGDIYDFRPIGEKIHHKPFYIGAAERLPIAPNSVDVVIDFKGALWNALYNLVEKEPTTPDFERLDTIINEYKRILTKDGMIIVDAYPLPELMTSEGEYNLIPSTVTLWERFISRFPEKAQENILTQTPLENINYKIPAPPPFGDIDLSSIGVWKI